MATLLNGTTFNGVRVCQNCSPTNTIVGFEAGDAISGTACRNTIFGYQASKWSNNSCDTSVMGFKALGGEGGSNRDFCRTVAFGSYAMSNASSSNDNVAVGFKTMKNLGVNANGNVALGSFAGYGLNAGVCNTFAGYKAGCATSNGEKNVAIGYCAMTSLSNGNTNIGIGNFALCSVGNGSGNIGIGYRTGSSVVGANNTISIGCNVTTSDNNGHTAVGGSSVSTFCTATPWVTISDKRDKSDINVLNENLGLNFIRNLRPVKFNFDFRENYVKKCGFEYGVKDGTLKQTIESYGFIAQEIEQTMNNLNVEFESLNYEEDGDNYRLIYEGLISPIVKSLQQTINRLEILEDKVG
jgi:hypothetical protein